MFQTKTKLPPKRVEDAFLKTDTNFICCKRSATAEILHADSAPSLLRSALLGFLPAAVAG